LIANGASLPEQGVEQSEIVVNAGRPPVQETVGRKPLNAATASGPYSACIEGSVDAHRLLGLGGLSTPPTYRAICHSAAQSGQRAAIGSVAKMIVRFRGFVAVFGSDGLLEFLGEDMG